MSETPYVETEALLAALNEDHEALEAILEDMLPGELRKLAVAAQMVCDRALGVRRGKNASSWKGQRGLPHKLPKICEIPACGCDGTPHP